MNKNKTLTGIFNYLNCYTHAKREYTQTRRAYSRRDHPLDIVLCNQFSNWFIFVAIFPGSSERVGIAFRLFFDLLPSVVACASIEIQRCNLFFVVDIVVSAEKNRIRKDINFSHTSALGRGKLCESQTASIQANPDQCSRLSWNSGERDSPTKCASHRHS